MTLKERAYDCLGLAMQWHIINRANMGQLSTEAHRIAKGFQETGDAILAYLARQEDIESCEP